MAQDAGDSSGLDDGTIVKNNHPVGKAIHNRQVVPTPEEIFEQLWQQLRMELDSVDGAWA